ncbi:MAG: hypothetical protein QOD41_2831 [Cryptosporangiaceae bacterium]|jgi:hypothetical protein|nr:hypothetical protein [Cryptosporangiaceae bacterium]
MTEGHTSQGTQPAVDDAEEQSDWLTWSGGTVLPDEMIEHLRETIGALDALLASTYLSRDFELPGPDDLMPTIPRPTDEPAKPKATAPPATAPQPTAPRAAAQPKAAAEPALGTEEEGPTPAADPKPARPKPAEPRSTTRKSGKSPS